MTKQTYEEFACPNPKCKQPVKQVWGFCPHCHESLLVPCPRCGVVTRADHAFCPEVNCGVDLHDYEGLTLAEEKKLQRDAERAAREEEEKQATLEECQAELEKLDLVHRQLLLRLAGIAALALGTACIIWFFIQWFQTIEFWYQAALVGAALLFAKPLLKGAKYGCAWWAESLTDTIHLFRHLRQRIAQQEELLHSLSTPAPTDTDEEQLDSSGVTEAEEEEKIVLP